MKSKIVILTLVGLTAGAFGTVGTRILAGSETPPTAVADTSPVHVRAAAMPDPSRSACRGLTKKLSRGAMSDARLKRLIARHDGCRAVVIDSKALSPGASSPTRIVTIPATTTAPVSAVTQPMPTGGEDEAYEDEGEHEEDD